MEVEVGDYARMLAERGGIATCGDGLAVFVGHDARDCRQPGWTFVEMPTTPEIVQLALNEARLGRSHWPEKV